MTATKNQSSPVKDAQALVQSETITVEWSGRGREIKVSIAMAAGHAFLDLAMAVERGMGGFIPYAWGAICLGALENGMRRLHRSVPRGAT